MPEVLVTGRYPEMPFGLVLRGSILLGAPLALAC